MIILYSKSFLKSAKKLPSNIQKKLSEQLVYLEKNPFHSFLHTKPLTGKLLGLYSFRITRDWRVIFKFEDQENIFLIKTGNRKDIYK